MARARCVRSAAASPSGTGGASSTGGTSGTGGSGTTPSNKCPTPYRCNSATKVIDGLVRTYSQEKCDSATGDWTEFVDCSSMACSCKASTANPVGTNYAECSWAGKVCSGNNYTW